MSADASRRMTRRSGRLVLATTVAGLLLAGLAVIAWAAVVSEPAARWALDEGTGTTVADAIGDLDGTLEGSADWIADGRSGAALRLDGASRVVIADDPLLHADQLSIGLWVRGDPADLPADGEVILEKGDRGCGGGSYALVVDGGQVALHYRESAPEDAPIGIVSMDTAEALPSMWDGAWHLVGLVVSTDDDYGGVTVYQQSWGAGASLNSPRLAYDGFDVADLAIGGAADPTCGKPGFTGDVDEIAAYPGIVPRDTFRGQEDPVATTLELLDVGPLAVDGHATAHVRLGPAPIAPGRIRSYVTGEDGIERLAGGVSIDWPWALPLDGVFAVGVHPEDGGVGALRIAYEPARGDLPSEATQGVTIAKAASGVHVSLPYTYIEGEPISVGVDVGSIVYVHVNGTAELYEVTPGGPVLIGTQPVISPTSSFSAYTVFELPPGPAGERTFRARFLGGTAHGPSESDPVTIDVKPALVAGVLAINGGAAVTDDPVVTLDTPATGAIAMQVARSLEPDLGSDPPIPWAPTTTTWLTAPWHGDDADGIRTIWVRYADALNRWGAWQSDTIVLDRGVQGGIVTINKGAAATGTRAVSVSVPVAEPGKVAALQLSHDGKTWSTMPYATPVRWTMAGEGTRMVHVRWVDLDGRQSAPVTDSIIVDTKAPIVGSMRASVKAGAQPGGTIPVRLSWSLADAAGIRTQDVAIQRDGGTWTTLRVSAGTRAVVRNLAPGHDYRLRVRATDVLAHRSSWRIGPEFRVLARQETSSSITWRGPWRSARAGAYWGGGSRFSRADGASASLTFRGRAVAWVSPVGPTRGIARVYVDGAYVATVNLRAATAGNARVVFERSWTSVGSHTIRVVVDGTGGHPRVDVDGFVVLAPG